jgi:hypothetical protein
MSPEEFLSQFGYIPAIYDLGYMVSVNAHYYGEHINVKHDINGDNVYQVLNKLAKEVSGQLGAEYKDLEYTGSNERAQIFNLHQCTLRIPAHHMPFLDLLKEEINPIAKIELLEITENDFKKYLAHIRESLRKRAASLVSRTWMYKETGDILSDQSTVTELLTLADVKKLIKGKSTPIDNLKSLIDLFENTNSFLREVEA